MMGAVTSGNNVGGLAMPALAAALVTVGGWQLGYFSFGILLLLLALTAITVLLEDESLVAHEMNRTGRVAEAQESRQLRESGISLQIALRSRNFWLILCGLFSASFTYQGVLTQLRQHFAEQGFSPAMATTGLAVIAAMGIGSKLAFGRASECWTARLCSVVSISLQTVGLVIIAVATSAPVMWIGIFVFGMGFGGLGVLLVLIVQEAFGMKAFGSIQGIVQISYTLSIAIAPFLAGWIHDQTGSFSLAFLIITVIFILAIVCLLAARPPART
jgi:cyanate permease